MKKIQCTFCGASYQVDAQQTGRCPECKKLATKKPPAPPAPKSPASGGEVTGAGKPFVIVLSGAKKGRRIEINDGDVIGRGINSENLRRIRERARGERRARGGR